MRSPNEWAADLVAAVGGRPSQTRPAAVWAGQILADCRRQAEAIAAEGREATDEDWVAAVAAAVEEIQREAAGGGGRISRDAAARFIQDVQTDALCSVEVERDDLVRITPGRVFSPEEMAHANSIPRFAEDVADGVARVFHAALTREMQSWETATAANGRKSWNILEAMHAYPGGIDELVKAGKERGVQFSRGTLYRLAQATHNQRPDDKLEALAQLLAKVDQAAIGWNPGDPDELKAAWDATSAPTE